jgi:hypothetical protein
MIIARLPQSEETGEFEYRIRNLNEEHERVAKESELRADYPVLRSHLPMVRTQAARGRRPLSGLDDP